MDHEAPEDLDAEASIKRAENILLASGVRDEWPSAMEYVAERGYSDGAIREAALRWGWHSR